jgi:hypothetical protein
MPNFVGRLNVFYQSKAFKNAAEIQTGFKVYISANSNLEIISCLMSLFFLIAELLLAVNPLQMLILI